MDDLSSFIDDFVRELDSIFERGNGDRLENGVFLERRGVPDDFVKSFYEGLRKRGYEATFVEGEDGHEFSPPRGLLYRVELGYFYGEYIGEPIIPKVSRNQTCGSLVSV